MAAKTVIAEDRLLTPAEAARVCGVSYVTIRRWAARGLMTVVRTPGGQCRYREAEVRALMKEFPAGTDVTGGGTGRAC